MARAPSPPFLIATLAVGLAVGALLDRLGTAIPATILRAGPAARQAPDPAPRPASRPTSEAAEYEELARQYERFLPVNRQFELVARAVSPAVVHIVARKTGRRRREERWYRFEESGSGVIVRPGGTRGQYVLTNHHVIEGAEASEIAVTLHNGLVLKPERVWSDSKADVAVLKLGRDDLPAARLGDSDEAAIGSWVLALGSPFGLTHSVSQGIISARNRHEAELEDDGVENQEFLQTDAAINPGNSGGPLVNLKGEVIGINTAIASNGGGSEGVGFSIPINLARWIMDQLVATGKVSRGAMGVNLQPVLSQRAIDLGLAYPRGARVLSVGRPSPAADAGLREGDVILKFNGVDVLDVNHLINLVSMAPIGREAEVELWRDHQSIAARVVVADRDAVVARMPEPADRSQPDAPLRRPSRPTPAPAPADGDGP